jgi:hypothetical protein
MCSRDAHNVYLVSSVRHPGAPCALEEVLPLHHQRHVRPRFQGDASISVHMTVCLSMQVPVMTAYRFMPPCSFVRSHCAHAEQTRPRRSCVSTYGHAPLRVSRICYTHSLCFGGPWQLYIENYFPEANKVAAQEMLSQIRDKFREDLETVPWMDDSTRPKAIHKLDEMVFEASGSTPCPCFCSRPSSPRYTELCRGGRREVFADFQLFRSMSG